MYNLAKGSTLLAAVAFVIAVASNFMGPILQTPAEGFSRASTNLALIAIALVVVFGERSFPPGSRG